MKALRIATALQWVRDIEESTRWYRGLLGAVPAAYRAPYFKLDEGAYLILGPSFLGGGPARLRV